MEYFDLNGCILALTDSRNIVVIHRFINQLICGVYIQMDWHFFRVNCYESGAPQAPFGGFKMSGQGREW